MREVRRWARPIVTVCLALQLGLLGVIGLNTLDVAQAGEAQWCIRIGFFGEYTPPICIPSI